MIVFSIDCTGENAHPHNFFDEKFSRVPPETWLDEELKSLPRNFQTTYYNSCLN